MLIPSRIGLLVSNKRRGTIPHTAFMDTRGSLPPPCVDIIEEENRRENYSLSHQLLQRLIILRLPLDVLHGYHRYPPEV